MDSGIQNFLGVSFLLIGGLAMVMNVILVVIAWQLRKEGKRVNLILALALVNGGMGLTGAVAAINFLTTGNSVMAFKYGCAIKGSLDFVGWLLSMQLVFHIGLDKVLLIFGLMFPHWVGWLTLSYAAIYSILVLWSAWDNEFIVLPNGIDCAPNLMNDTVSAITIFLLGLSLLLYSCCTVACYLRILVKALTSYKGLPPPTSHCPQFTNALSKNRTRPVVIRTLVISLAYILLVMPPASLLLFQADYTVTNRVVVPVIIDLSMALIPLANPCLILFVHSIVYHKLSTGVRQLLGLPPNDIHASQTGSLFSMQTQLTCNA